MDLAASCPSAFTGLAGQSFAAFINTLMAAQCALTSHEIYPSNYAPHLKNGDEFDFIVVGAGSAGSIVSNRLSENPDWKVLVIEAGDYPSSITQVPKMFFAIAETEEDWGYHMEPSENACLGINDRLCGCPRGKTLGGSSSINGMIYIRGNRKDYDTWGALGNEGWDYDSVFPLFKKFESLQGVEDERMGKDGEMKITRYENDYPVREIFINAYKEMGFGEYSEENPQGYLDAYTNIYDGTRYGTAKAFIAPMKDRKNVFVAVGAQVSRVLLGEDLTATGVEVRIGDRLITVHATKEVILSAGTINSAQILMNSGIGPEEHLEELGIPVLKNLRVGENLQDHMFFTGLMMNMGPEVLVEKTSTNVMDEWDRKFFVLLGHEKHSKYPSLEMFYIPVYKNDPYRVLPILQKALHLPPEVVKAQNENNKKANNIFLVPAVAYTKSVGKILLSDKDPFSTPKIFSNYFSDEKGEDLQVLLEGVRFFQKLTKTKTFAPHNPEFVDFGLVNCKSFEVDSDDYWRCVIQNMATTVYHLAGTCKMGPKDDPAAVVDARLRVYGVKRLRVVDASIMPTMISCNINAATIMIGQKASEMIKEDWSKQQRTEL
ncbi:hypothetical protein FQR65_LT05000 [Abscondita terminalis]|nr:hypothetical protein FQR65_LT05000 [Abscondita terminalis]